MRAYSADIQDLNDINDLFEVHESFQEIKKRDWEVLRSSTSTG